MEVVFFTGTLRTILQYRTKVSGIIKLLLIILLVLSIIEVVKMGFGGVCPNPVDLILLEVIKNG